MRNSNKRKAFFMLLALISSIFASFILSSGYDIHNNLGESTNLDSLNSSAGEITIVSPENITYGEPMSGYYPAVNGFENELEGTSGTTIDYVDVTTISSGCEVQIYDEVQGHKKVLRLHDGNAAGNARAQHNFASTHTTGSVEWWWLSPSSGNNNMAFHFHEGLLGTHAGRVLMQDDSFKDMDSIIVQSYVANQWYHHKVVFNTISDTYDWYIDGILRVNDGNFENPVANIGSTNIKGGWASTGSCYVNAIGYDWYPNYNSGDNLIEGLLLSYENTTTLDWIGYSLDGTPNITIAGNKVINFPENGIHSIILSGTTSVGTIVKSDLRYFTVITTDPLIPPLPPNIPLIILVLLIGIGIGIVAMIGIIFFIYRRRIQSRKRFVITSRSEPQLGEKRASGSEVLRVCPYCFTKIKGTHKYCIVCGASLQND